MNKIREWWSLYSIRFAAAVAALVGLLTSQPEVLFAVVGLIPVDPVARGIFALAVAALTFLAPTVARMWPQNTTEKPDGE